MPKKPQGEIFTFGKAGEPNSPHLQIEEYAFLRFCGAFSSQDFNTSYRRFLNVPRDRIDAHANLYKDNLFSTRVDNKQFGDVQELINIIMLPYSLVLAQDNLPRFQEAFQTQLTAEEFFSSVGFRMWHTTAARLSHYIHAMTVGTEKDWLLKKQQIPDLRLPEYTTTEARLDKVIDMLILTHEVAVQRVSGLSPTEYAGLKKSDKAKYMEIARQAGIYMGRNTFYGLHTNLAGDKGLTNDFVADPTDPDSWDRTRRRRCPAENYVRTYFEGLGIFLKENREWVLEHMREAKRN